jgi:hypothetical protein
LFVISLSSAKQATNITQMLECLTLVREFVASFLDDSFNLFHCLLLMELYSLSFFVGCFTYPSAGFSQSRNIFARWSQTPAAPKVPGLRQRRKMKMAGCWRAARPPANIPNTDFEKALHPSGKWEQTKSSANCAGKYDENNMKYMKPNRS